jgi:hypothetical protein
MVKGTSDDWSELEEFSSRKISVPLNHSVVGSDKYKTYSTLSFMNPSDCNDHNLA